MKKLLLATAAFAIIAPAAQAEIKLDLGGYFKGYAAYADQDTDDLREFDIKRKSEVYFQGETTLDNGLTVGFHSEMFQENGSDNLEASYLYFSGNWGRVNLGRENGAAYLLQVTAPSADANLDGADIDFSFFNAGGTLARQDYAAEGASQYSDKITYLSPKFNGFQAGVSYSAAYDSKTTTDYENGLSSDDDSNDLENFIEGAIRYDGEFQGVGVHVGGGYAVADEEIDATGDLEEYNVGLKLSYEGFSLGGAYISTEREDETEIDTYVIGAGYDYGAYNFGATYFNSEEDLGGTDELDRYTIGAGYTFGPGMKFVGSVAFFDGEGNAAAEDNDATVVAIGTDIQF